VYGGQTVGLGILTEDRPLSCHALLRPARDADPEVEVLGE
jgi:hypothetical protein